ncbi:hypothetical protein PDESU_01176 [Pontiella desulfatans]|uniref:Tyr recombinase domain-containing protein n=1 Tax=Pontiella desulfatans TaxID=2750659 RepID=A0A6C2TYD5_PONDE|nr:tyrosine-type recombinase/integrase [Pontiella desulfatans]VGO12623.1 hypothetical protein PDESU_01176 [Pontiella desulfatans]
MGLAIRKDSKWWYGRYYVDGKEFVKRLNVEVSGERPSKLSLEGDKAFERSRIKAEEALNVLLADVHSNKTEEQRAQAVYEARAGSKLRKYKLSDLSKIWLEKPRKRAPSEEHRKQCISKLEKFSGFIELHYPKVSRVDQVRYDHVKAFLDHLEEDGVTAETWNKYLSVIRSVLRRVGVPAAADIITKDADTVFREPYSIEELNAILDKAKSDSLIFSLVVTAACTAMRRKDCCYLLWESIDFEERFITVKTSKTGVTVDIPMADLLADLVEGQKGNGSTYVFPDAKELYESDPTAITRRFKQVLRLAGFGKAPVEYKADAYTLDELKEKSEELYAGNKLKHVLDVVEAYCSGLSMRKSAERAGVTISTASLYLNDLESATGKAIIRGKARTVDDGAGQRRGEIRRSRKNGKLAASIRDFHSFRTTWVTLALMNGMPIETVRKVTGHQTADIVTKHYFRPHRAELKKAMQKSLPGLLTSSSSILAPNEQALEELRAIGRKMDKSEILRRVDEAISLLERK